MHRLNIGFWNHLGKQLTEVSRIDLEKAGIYEVWPYYPAVQALDELEKTKVLEIKTSRGAWEELRKALQNALNAVISDGNSDAAPNPVARMTMGGVGCAVRFFRFTTGVQTSAMSGVPSSDRLIVAETETLGGKRSGRGQPPRSRTPWLALPHPPCPGFCSARH